MQDFFAGRMNSIDQELFRSNLFIYYLTWADHSVFSTVLSYAQYGCSSIASNEDLDKTILNTRRLVTMSSEMANKPNVGTE